ncbi:MAG: bifunctional ornithine acetyltransferase/N-acetylglutamate synthase, partial [Candidatus Aenigmatarchaeota archaeon]
MKLPQGFLFSGINCGIKKDKKLDLGLIYCEDFAKGIGFFTSNVNPSYSVIWSKKNINNPIKAILVNSGNANCFSHRSGIKDTQEIMKRLAEELKVKDKNVLFASTGIIGKILPKQKIIRAIPILIKNLKKNVKDFSTSILTTDTFEKV